MTEAKQELAGVASPYDPDLIIDPNAAVPASAEDATKETQESEAAVITKGTQGSAAGASPSGPDLIVEAKLESAECASPSNPDLNIDPNAAVPASAEDATKETQESEAAVITKRTQRSGASPSDPDLNIDPKAAAPASAEETTKKTQEESEAAVMKHKQGSAAGASRSGPDLIVEPCVAAPTSVAAEARMEGSDPQPADPQPHPAANPCRRGQQHHQHHRRQRPQLRPGAVWVGPSDSTSSSNNNFALLPVPLPPALRRYSARSLDRLLGRGDSARESGEAVLLSSELAPDQEGDGRGVTEIVMARVLSLGRAPPLVEGVAAPMRRGEGDPGGEGWTRCLGDDRQCLCRMRRFLVLAGVVAAVAAIGVSVGIGVSRSRPGSDGTSDTSSSKTSSGSNYEHFSERYRAFHDMLYGSEDLPLGLGNADSPQSQALAWLADQDPAALEPSREEGVARAKQRHALTTLHYATSKSNGADGTAWVNNCSFLSGEHECNWNKDGLGVFCEEGSEFTTLLDLRANNLNGTLPSEIGWLSGLTKLVLPLNKLHGSIPPTIGALRNLTFLDIWLNDLSGQIPDEMSHLSNLEVLWIITNSFTGAMPDVRNSSRLKVFSVSDNAFTGTLPGWLGDLKDLEFLGIGSNLVTGAIPSSIAHLPKLEQLFLYEDDLQADFVPLFPGAFPSLRALVAWNANLKGSIPAAIGTLSELEQLVLRGNQLRGTLPEAALGNLSKLSALSLGNNELSGTVSHVIGGTSGSLKHLLLGGNELRGSIPESLVVRNPQLLVLTLDENHFTGTIPSALSNIEKLWLLDLHSNLLTGTIPAGLSNITELRYLELSDNSIVGTVPELFRNLEKLDFFSVARNNLQGNMSFLCGDNKINELYSDCASPMPEVHCPCCTTCCNDLDDKEECHEPLPTYVIIRQACFQAMAPMFPKRSENYNDLICPPETHIEHFTQNEKRDNGGGRRLLRTV